MKTIKIVYPLALIFLTWSCGSDTEVPNGGNGFGSGGGGGNATWTIPIDEVFDGGPGKDGIPALELPNFITPAEATYLFNDDLVVGYKVGNDIRAYPHKIMDWHEIINDRVNDKPVAITYCPLTGTAIGWTGVVNGQETTFGVSGLLYNTNLIPYDRVTDSNWSQMLLESVNGESINTKIETFQVIETTWGTWKEWYPNTKVVSTDTGFDRSYTSFPYFIQGQDYRIDPLLIFPIKVDDARLPRKDRVHGIIANSQAKAYTFSSFQTGDFTLIEDSFAGKDIVIVGSESKNFIISFETSLPDGTALEFTKIDAAFPIILEDNEGNQWDVFGEAVSGPRVGERLTPTESFIGYWFSWGTFYPGLDIY